MSDSEDLQGRTKQAGVAIECGTCGYRIDGKWSTALGEAPLGIGRLPEVGEVVEGFTCRSDRSCSGLFEVVET